MSPLDPDELTRLLTQAVEPIRPDPDAYQQIRSGIDRHGRMRVPLYALVGFAAAALFVLAAIALQPQQPAQVVEPGNPITDSQAGPVPGGDGLPSGDSKPGSGGGRDDGSQGTETPPGTTRTTPPPTSTPSGTATASPTASPSDPTGESPTMPSPAAMPAENGDIDGDGIDDKIEMAGPTLLRATLSRGYQATLAMPAVATPLHYTVVDVDGNGFGEVFVRTGAENEVERFVMLRLMNPEKIVLVDSSSTALVAGIDDERDSAAGFRCSPGSPGSLVSYTGTAAGDGQYNVITQTWRLEGTTLVRESTTTTGPSADTSIFRADCGTL